MCRYPPARAHRSPPGQGPGLQAQQRAKQNPGCRVNSPTADAVRASVTPGHATVSSAADCLSLPPSADSHAPAELASGPTVRLTHAGGGAWPIRSTCDGADGVGGVADESDGAPAPGPPGVDVARPGAVLHDGRRVRRPQHGLIVLRHPRQHRQCALSYEERQVLGCSDTQASNRSSASAGWAGRRLHCSPLLLMACVRSEVHRHCTLLRGCSAAQDTNLHHTKATTCRTPLVRAGSRVTPGARWRRWAGPACRCAPPAWT